MPDIAAASWKVSEAARRFIDALVWDDHGGFGPIPRSIWRSGALARRRGRLSLGQRRL